MPGTLNKAEASPELIYALLRPDEDLINSTPFTWSEALTLGAADETLGQIVGARGERLPADIRLRGVGLIVAGTTSIRWLDPGKARRVLPGVTHDYLLCRGDQPEETRSGWLLRTGDLVAVQ
jgi:hypothetical protein